MQREDSEHLHMGRREAGEHVAEKGLVDGALAEGASVTGHAKSHPLVQISVLRFT